MNSGPYARTVSILTTKPSSQLQADVFVVVALTINWCLKWSLTERNYILIETGSAFLIENGVKIKFSLWEQTELTRLFRKK